MLRCQGYTEKRKGRLAPRATFLRLQGASREMEAAVGRTHWSLLQQRLITEQRQIQASGKQSQTRPTCLAMADFWRWSWEHTV